MKMNSDYANKIIRNLSEEESFIEQAERDSETYSYGVGEEPIVPEYDFLDTQKRLAEIREKISIIRHAINVFNITTKIRDFDITVDEALRKMSILYADKRKYAEMLKVPEQNRVRPYGAREADIVCRNYDIADVQAEYDRVSDELMRIQQAINIANLTVDFEVDVEL